MTITSIGSSEEISTNQSPSSELEGIYGEKIQAIRKKIANGDFHGARDQIDKEFAEIDAKYKGCYLFLELAKFKGELTALKKQITAKL